MRKTLLLAIPFVLLSVSFGDAFGQEKAATDIAAVKSAIERGGVAWAAAMNSGKYGDVAVLYADDAIVLPPEAAVVKGNAAIKEFWSGMAAFKPTDWKLATEEVEVHGDVAIETGTYSLKLTPPGAKEAIADNGKYMVVWKRQSDGSWKIYRDMYSTNIPRK